MEGGEPPSCKEAAELEAPINLTEPGSLRYCQPPQTKQIAGESTESRANAQKTREITATTLFSEIHPLACSIQLPAEPDFICMLRKGEGVWFILE